IRRDLAVGQPCGGRRRGTNRPLRRSALRRVRKAPGSAFDPQGLEALSEEELAEKGIDDVRRALKVLGRISAEGMNLRGMRSDHPDLPAHSTVAMIAGMAALRSTYFGAKPPSREVIVEELIQAILHGFLHRND